MCVASDSRWCSAGSSRRGKNKEPPEAGETTTAKRARTEGTAAVLGTAEAREEALAAEEEAQHLAHLKQLQRRKHALMVMLKSSLGSSHHSPRSIA
jgi:hypothetical protein